MFNEEEIREVTAKELSEFIRNWCYDIPGIKQNKFRVFCKQVSGIYTAIDNTTGHCLIKRFKTRQEAIVWLEIEKKRLMIEAIDRQG